MDWHSGITGFKAYLRMERGLSMNSVEAYERDVEKLAVYMQNRHGGIGPCLLYTSLRWIEKESGEW